MFDIFRWVANLTISPIHQLFFLVFLTALLVFWKPRWAKISSVLLAAHLLFFSSRTGLWLSVSPLENMYPPVTLTPALDAVVVLTGGTAQFDPKTEQNVWGTSSSRFLEAIRLYKKSGSKYFVISGSTPRYAGPLEYELPSMARLALEYGIPRENILLEPNSKATSQHPLELKNHFFAHNIQSFYLVTSAYHMVRAMKVFEKQGARPIAFPVGQIFTYSNSIFSLGYYFAQDLALHEWTGLLAYSFIGSI